MAAASGTVPPAGARPRRRTRSRQSFAESLSRGDAVWALLSDGYVAATVLSSTALSVIVETVDGQRRPLPRSAPPRRRGAKATPGPGFATVLPRDHESSSPEHPGFEDMDHMLHLHEAAILHNVATRFQRDEIYTSTGPILIALNPCKAISRLYSPQIAQEYHSFTAGQAPLPPHCYGTAEAALRVAVGGPTPQETSIVICGESGAGKTETTKLMLSYLSTVTEAGAGDMSQRVMETNPVLEAFGNAKTARNHNSSRFGKLIKVLFKAASQGSVSIAGATITSYLLEKSRSVAQPKGERNFHIFYQLLAGGGGHREQLLLGSAADYVCTSRSGCMEVSGIDDAAGFEDTLGAMAALGQSEEEQAALLRMLGALLHMSNLTFIPHDGDDGSEGSAIPPSPALSVCASLLGVTVDDLSHALTHRCLHLAGKDIVSPLRPDAAASCRDALAKSVYSAVFDRLMVSVNAAVAVQGQAAHVAAQGSVGILDVFGLENMAHNGFEQLFINFTNERLQQVFNHVVFTSEKDEYASEGIPFADFALPDNSQCIECLEGKGGVLALMNEECMLGAQGSDKQLAGKLYKVLADHPNFQQAGPTSPFRRSTTEFAVVHFAGPIVYTCTDFVEKNRDSVSVTATACLQRSSFHFAASLLAAGVPGSRQSMRGTVASHFKGALSDLVAQLRSTHSTFVRCIKTNAALVPGKMEAMSVLSQLSYAGVIAALETRKHGYPSRLPFLQFVLRYRGLAREPGARMVPEAQVSSMSRGELVDMCSAILGNPCLLQVGVEASSAAMGRTRVFLKAEVLGTMDRVAFQLHNAAVCKVQAVVKGQQQHMRYCQSKHAALLLQAATRGHQVRKEHFARMEAVRCRHAVAIASAAVDRLQDALCTLESRAAGTGVTGLESISQELARSSRAVEALARAVSQAKEALDLHAAPKDGTHASKYHGVQLAVALLPTATEWCSMVSAGDSAVGCLAAAVHEAMLLAEQEGLSRNKLRKALDSAAVGKEKALEACRTWCVHPGSTLGIELASLDSSQAAVASLQKAGTDRLLKDTVDLVAQLEGAEKELSVAVQRQLQHREQVAGVWVWCAAVKHRAEHLWEAGQQAADGFGREEHEQFGQLQNLFNAVSAAISASEAADSPAFTLDSARELVERRLVDAGPARQPASLPSGWGSAQSACVALEDFLLAQKVALHEAVEAAMAALTAREACRRQIKQERQLFEGEVAAFLTTCSLRSGFRQEWQRCHGGPFQLALHQMRAAMGSSVVPAESELQLLGSTSAKEAAKCLDDLGLGSTSTAADLAVASPAAISTISKCGGALCSAAQELSGRGPAANLEGSVMKLKVLVREGVASLCAARAEASAGPAALGELRSGSVVSLRRWLNKEGRAFALLVAAISAAHLEEACEQWNEAQTVHASLEVLGEALFEACGPAAALHVREAQSAVADSEAGKEWLRSAAHTWCSSLELCFDQSTEAAQRAAAVASSCHLFLQQPGISTCLLHPSVQHCLQSLQASLGAVAQKVALPIEVAQNLQVAASSWRSEGAAAAAARQRKSHATLLTALAGFQQYYCASTTIPAVETFTAAWQGTFQTAQCSTSDSDDDFPAVSVLGMPCLDCWAEEALGQEAAVEAAHVQQGGTDSYEAAASSLRACVLRVRKQESTARGAAVAAFKAAVQAREDMRVAASTFRGSLSEIDSFVSLSTTSRLSKKLKGVEDLATSVLAALQGVCSSMSLMLPKEAYSAAEEQVWLHPAGVILSGAVAMDEQHCLKAAGSRKCFPLLHDGGLPGTPAAVIQRTLQLLQGKVSSLLLKFGGVQATVQMQIAARDRRRAELAEGAGGLASVRAKELEGLTQRLRRAQEGIAHLKHSILASGEEGCIALLAEITQCRESANLVHGLLCDCLGSMPVSHSKVPQLHQELDHLDSQIESANQSFLLVRQACSSRATGAVLGDALSWLEAGLQPEGEGQDSLWSEGAPNLIANRSQLYAEVQVSMQEASRRLQSMREGLAHSYASQEGNMRRLQAACTAIAQAGLAIAVEHGAVQVARLHNVLQQCYAAAVHHGGLELQDRRQEVGPALSKAFAEVQQVPHLPLHASAPDNWVHLLQQAGSVEPHPGDGGAGEFAADLAAACEGLTRDRVVHLQQAFDSALKPIRRLAECLSDALCSSMEAVFGPETVPPRSAVHAALAAAMELRPSTPGIAAGNKPPAPCLQPPIRPSTSLLSPPIGGARALGSPAHPEGERSRLGATLDRLRSLQGILTTPATTPLHSTPSREAVACIAAGLARTLPSPEHPADKPGALPDRSQVAGGDISTPQELQSWLSRECIPVSLQEAAGVWGSPGTSMRLDSSPEAQQRARSRELSRPVRPPVLVRPMRVQPKPQRAPVQLRRGGTAKSKASAAHVLFRMRRKEQLERLETVANGRVFIRSSPSTSPLQGRIGKTAERPFRARRLSSPSVTIR